LQTRKYWKWPKPLWYVYSSLQKFRPQFLWFQRHGPKFKLWKESLNSDGHQQNKRKFKKWWSSIHQYQQNEALVLTELTKHKKTMTRVIRGKILNIYIRDRDGNALLFWMKENCDVKIKFCTNGCPMVYGFQVLGIQI
jgi:hypothetical protein